MPDQTVPSIFAVACYSKLIFSGRIQDFECGIFCISFLSFKIGKVYSQCGISSLSEPVYLVESQPELSIEVTKSLHIVGPVAIEVHSSIHSPLKHHPTPTVTVHVTVNLKKKKKFSQSNILVMWAYTHVATWCWAYRERRQAIWLDSVDSAASLSQIQGLLAVTVILCSDIVDINKQNTYRK